MNTIYNKYYILKSLIAYEKEFNKIQKESFRDAGIMEDDDVIKYYLHRYKDNYNKYLNILNDKYNISKETLDKILKEEKIRKTSFMKHEDVIQLLKRMKNKNEENKKRQEISKLKEKNWVKFYKKITEVDMVAMSKIKNLITVKDLIFIEKNKPNLLQNNLLSSFIENNQLEEFLFIYRRNLATISNEQFIETLFIDIQFKDEQLFLKKMKDLLNEKEKLIIVEEKKYIPQLKYESGDILKDMVVATLEKSLINQSFNNPNDEKIIIRSNKKRM